MKGLGRDIFISRAKLLHSNKFDYSNVDYINNRTKIKIICPIHGEFEQTPTNHLLNNGCIQCINLKKSTKNDFIKRANKVHYNKYDYSKVEYIGSRNKIVIVCPEHGEFIQRADAHLSGNKCPVCKINILKDLKISTTEFIIEAKNIHGNKYDYSLVEYTGSKSNIKIICSKHGVFKQRAENHRRGSGCPLCNGSKGEELISKYLNSKEIKYNREYKFSDCRNILPLPFDFYIPSTNTCIEYDGIQHHEPRDFFGGKEAFKELNKRDKIKDKYCKDNNIKLIRIKYNENTNKKLGELI